MNQEKERNPLQEKVFKPLDQLSELNKFWNTRKAILHGVPLYDWGDRERKRDGYLGAWAFNLRESAIASFPVALFIQILSFLFDEFKNEPQNIDTSLGKGVRIFNEILPSTISFFAAFLVPIFITLLTFLLARNSLKSSDRTEEREKRARRAYLYLDGAHGLYSQFLLSLVTSLMTWESEYKEIVEILPVFIIFPVRVILAIVFLAGFFGQFIQTNSVVPRKLFKINGYSSRIRYFFWQKKRHDDPPFAKYQLALSLGLPLFIILSMLLFLCSALTAGILAWFKMILPFS